jgi:hypothetical protein
MTMNTTMSQYTRNATRRVVGEVKMMPRKILASIVDSRNSVAMMRVQGNCHGMISFMASRAV